MTDPPKRVLYVGNLDARVDEQMLTELFAPAGAIESVKIIPAAVHKQGPGLTSYGFVEFVEHEAALNAIQTYNDRLVMQAEIKVNWAAKNKTHIFVGDLSSDVNDEVLAQAFSIFPSMTEARVMWDPKTGRSRGYGFVSFADAAEAENARQKMDGEWLGSRNIRCNRASQRNSHSQQMGGNSSMGGQGGPGNGNGSATDYESVVQQAPAWQTTVYVGNLSPYTTQNEIVPLFQSFGYVVDVRIQPERGYAFVRMDSHQVAALAIAQINGVMINGRPAKCGWGRDQNSGNMAMGMQGNAMGHGPVGQRQNHHQGHQHQQQQVQQALGFEGYSNQNYRMPYGGGGYGNQFQGGFRGRDRGYDYQRNM
ncbi:nuclear and cytoplasmic polyadenylated RNA-binding protein pub1 [Myxozyma melibiosi]|uniref:Nuclear and cytoplasmic polyadenylated RNA-binding protein pub1 n=1 Tax=Myxozyma melibiosi TaxID=54550 RepID=A0ABR1F601_9ASCO